jgi:hypothetical protein
MDRLYGVIYKKNIRTLILRKFYVCMYAYNPFSPHNDITILYMHIPHIYLSRLLIITLILCGIIIFIAVIINVCMYKCYVYKIILMRSRICVWN